MALPQTVDREAVKVLAIAVGVRESARRMGLPEATVQAWSARDKWFADTPKPHTITRPNGATSATKTPSVALENVMKARQGKTRLHLSKYLVNASKVASRSRSPLKDASDVNQVANVMAKVWPERDQQPSGPFNLNLMGGRAVIQVNHSTPSPSVQE